MAARRLALVFPGQGSQRAGMAQELLANWPRITKDVLDEASEAADVNLLTLLRDGPQDKLTQTAVAQPAILAHSIAVLRVLEHESGFDVQSRAAFVLGHSLGEYSALVAAKSLAFADAIKLVVRPASRSSASHCSQRGRMSRYVRTRSLTSYARTSLRSAFVALRCKQQSLQGSAPWLRSCQ